MFSFIGRFLAKRALPIIAGNLKLRVNTVEKSDGFYLSILVTVFGFTLLDEQIKFSSQSTAGIQAGDQLRLDQPIDEVRDMNIKSQLDQLNSESTKAAMQQLNSRIRDSVTDPKRFN